MAEAKGKRKKQKPDPETVETESNETEPSNLLSTGLEDYGRWKSMFKDHKRDKNEKPFRRGRIWC